MDFKTRTLCDIWEVDACHRKMVEAANSQECLVQFPFLDNYLVQLTCNLPQSERYIGRQNKILLRKIIERHLPKNIVTKPKGSFNFPKQIILRGRQFEMLRVYLSDDMVHRYGIVDPEIVKRYVIEYMKGNNSMEDRIWILLMLHTWLEE